MELKQLTDNALRDRYRYYCELLCRLLKDMRRAVADDSLDEKIECLAHNDVKKFLPVLEEIRAEVLRRNSDGL